METNRGLTSGNCVSNFGIYVPFRFHFGSTGQILVPVWFQQPGRAAGRAAGTKMEPELGQWNRNET